MLELLSVSFKTLANAVPGGVAEGLIWSVLTVGVFISFRVLNFADMSVEGTFALGGTVTAALVTGGVPIGLCMIVGALCGFVAGAFTAVLHTKVKIPAILSGIMTMFILYSLNIHILGNKASLSLLGESTFTAMLVGAGLTNVQANLILSFAVVVIIAVATYWFFGTQFGTSVRATGCNADMARAQGVNTDLRIIVALGASNALAAVSGTLLAQANNVATNNMGTGAIVIGLAGVVLGETFVKDRYPFWAKLIAVVVGSVLYRMIIAFALQLMVGILTTDDMKLISAVIIIIVLAVKRFSRAKPAKKALTGGGNDA